MTQAFIAQSKKITTVTKKVDKVIRLQQITLTEDQQKEIKLEAANCYQNF